jgi:DNA-binding MarR family transcriptional regulator
MQRPQEKLHAAGTLQMSENIDVQEMSSCVCQSARQLARHLTQLYDAAVAPSGLTAIQFSLLARLYGLGNNGRTGVPLGLLAQRLRRHASTVTRDLKPLAEAKLVVLADDASDRRVRNVTVTAKGVAHLQKAFPLWRQAQTLVRDKLGLGVTSELKHAMDGASVALERRG